MDFYKQSAGHSSLFVIENNFLSLLIRITRHTNFLRAFKGELGLRKIQLALTSPGFTPN